MQPKRKEFPDFKRTAADWAKFKSNMMVYAGNTAVNFFQDSFRRKGFIDKSFKPWKKRKVVKTRGSLMLVSGRLKNSIRITRITSNSVAVGTDVPYAKIHNEGGRVNQTVSVREHSRRLKKRLNIQYSSVKTKKLKSSLKTFKTETRVKAHTRKVNFEMPQRQFIGDSQLLTKRIEMHLFRTLDKFLDKSFK